VAKTFLRDGDEIIEGPANSTNFHFLSQVEIRSRASAGGLPSFSSYLEGDSWFEIPPEHALSLIQGKPVLGGGTFATGSFFGCCSAKRNDFSNLQYNGKWQGKPAAIKFIFPRLGAAAMLVKELQLMSAIKSPFLVHTSCFFYSFSF